VANRGSANNRQDKAAQGLGTAEQRSAVKPIKTTIDGTVAALPEDDACRWRNDVGSDDQRQTLGNGDRSIPHGASAPFTHD
jgi:hypothetical protein